MLVVTRHSPVDAAKFESEAREAIAALAVRPGCESIELVAALDEAGLYLIVSRWRDVGSYRRALSSFDVKVAAVPVLASAADEPSAFGLRLRAGADGSVEQFESDRAPDADTAGPL